MIGQNADGVDATTARRLLALLAARQVDGRLPSLVAGVVRGGRQVWTGAYGDTGEDPADRQYRIGSITKTFTAVLVLQLVRDGQLELEAPASRQLGDVPYADRTLRTLLAHASGMQSEPHGPWWERSAGVSWDDLVAAQDPAAAAFPRGQQYHYSNLGYALLGEVAARAAGRPWYDAVRERILDPLGLDRTTYLPARAAQGWSVDPYARTLTAEPATDTGAMAPAGQLWSTVGDLATYAAFLGQGHPDVLDRSWLDLSAHPQSGDHHDGLEQAYGLGFQLRRGGAGLLVGHTGSMPGFLAACLVDRARGTGAVLVCNATTGLDPGALARDLLEELERCEPTLPPPWRPTTEVPATLAGVLGVWHWGNTAYVAALDGEHLTLCSEGRAEHRFAVGDGGLVGVSGYHAGETFHVVRREDGSVSHLECATFVYTRTPYDPAAPIPGGHPGR